MSVASAVKWSQRLRQTGGGAAKQMGGVRRAVLAGERDWLLARIKAAPDLTLRALAAELAERGVVVSHWAVWKFCMNEGLTFKKSILPSEQDRPDVARRRARWHRFQASLDASRLVFIDETWAKTNMVRLHGRALCGQRLHAKVPHGHWKTLTFVAALRSNGIDAPCVLDGPINGVSFLAYVEQILVPTLVRGEIVVMDNLGSHKNQSVRAAVRAVGANLFSCRPTAPT